MVTRTRKERFIASYLEQGIGVPTAEKLGGIAEKTAQRRGRIEPQDAIYDPLPPQVEPTPPVPTFLQPPPPPAAPKPIPFVTIGGSVFTESQYLTAKKKSSPCGDFAPYAQEHTGLMRIFCTAADFANAGYKLPTTTPKSTRGKQCPSGETWWSGKCKKVSFSEATFL